MKKIALVLLCLGLFFGCKDQGIDSQSFSSGNEVSLETQQLSQDMDKKSYEGLEDIFKDTSLIETNNKYLLMIFGKNNCKYCDKLKDEIKHSNRVKEYIKENFSAYYVNISYDKKHHLAFIDKKEIKQADVATSQLADGIYKVFSTPTIIFGDKDGKTIFEIPGYVPEERFYKTLEFIVSNKWQKGRSDKERLKILQDFIEGK